MVSGMAREKSPNIGLVVTASLCMGDHSQHGRVWRCFGEGVKQFTDGGEYVVTNEADFPVAWLQKIEPPPTKHKAKHRELAH